MTVARQVIAGRTYLISRRCTQRQFLLRPSAHTEQVYLYCLGEAAARYNITIHGFVAMSNHTHLVIRDNTGNYPEFLAHFHKMVAKAMNAHFNRWENFWAAEQVSAVYLVEREDRFRKLVYLLANPVAEDLVDQIAEWPGACSFRTHLSGQRLTIEKPLGYFREDGPMPPQVTIELKRLDGFEELSDAEWIDKLSTALREEEERARERRRVTGKQVLGKMAVLRTKPTDTPMTVARRRGLRPSIACADPDRRMEELAHLVLFRATRLLCLNRLRDGDSNIAFPTGTYRLRIPVPSALPPCA